MTAISTNAVRTWRALERSPTNQWVDWATQRLVAGDDTPHLRMLAGLTPPFDQRETTRILDDACAELGLGPLVREDMIRAYVGELLRTILDGSQSMTEVLGELANLCIESDYDRVLYPFYLLHFARDDLAHRDFQSHWEGADRANIDRIVREQAQEWLTRHGRTA